MAPYSRSILYRDAAALPDEYILHPAASTGRLRVKLGGGLRDRCMSSFEFVEPRSLQDAFALLDHEDPAV
ncbi:MAG TPA: hypothetical protein VGH13_06355, partial [Xanthobacteraceae bacterium]